MCDALRGAHQARVLACAAGLSVCPLTGPDARPGQSRPAAGQVRAGAVAVALPRTQQRERAARKAALQLRSRRGALEPRQVRCGRVWMTRRQVACRVSIEDVCTPRRKRLSVPVGSQPQPSLLRESGLVGARLVLGLLGLRRARPARGGVSAREAASRQVSAQASCLPPELPPATRKERYSCEFTS